jgi:hypothetical protein
MKFSECIDIAVTSGKVKPDKGEEAKAAYDAAFRGFRAQGLSERASDDRAAVAAIDTLGTRTTSKKWQKINELRSAADIYDTLTKTQDPAHELYMLGNKIDASAKTLTNWFHSMIAQNIEKYRVRAGGLWRPIEDMDQVIRASFKEQTAAEPKVLYEEIAQVQNAMRKRMNLEGTNLFEDPDGHIPLQQERGKVLQLQKKLGKGVAKDDWVREHLDGLNWDKVRDKNNEEIPYDDREEYLSKQFDNMMTKGKIARQPTQQFAAALAQRLSHPDHYFYKDADTWLAMNDKYGSGTVFQQITSHIQTRAKEIALLKHLGPNPVTMQNFMDNVASKRAAELDQANPHVPKLPQNTMEYRTAKEFRMFEQRYRILAGEVPTSDSILAQSLGTAKNVVSVGILPMAFIANNGDVAQAINTLALHKIPASGYLQRMMNDFAKLPTKEKRQQALQNIGGMESAMSGLLLHQRYNGIVGDGWQWSNRIADSFFRATWMVPWTQAERWAWNGHLQARFADFAGKALDEVPFAESMKSYGITAQDWDTFRQTPLHEPDGQHLLRPFDMLDRTDLDKVEAQKLAEKFQDWISYTSFSGAPEPTSRVQVALGHATDPNSYGGAALRSLGFIKAFSAMTFMTYLKDAMAVPTMKGKIGAVARYGLVMTLAGAYITQMKELAKGNDPLNMNPLTNPQFWLRSVLNGGSMGFLGDVIFGTLGAYSHGGLAEILAGPLPQFGDAVKNLTLDDTFDYLNTARTSGLSVANAKYHGLRDLGTFVQRYNPTPWQLKLVIQRSLMDDALRLSNPRAYQSLRTQQQQRENAGQGSWWGVGEKAPTRAPNLGGVIGLQR